MRTNPVYTHDLNRRKGTCFALRNSVWATVPFEVSGRVRDPRAAIRSLYYRSVMHAEV